MLVTSVPASRAPVDPGWVAEHVARDGFATVHDVITGNELDQLRAMVDAAVEADAELAPIERRDEARGRVLFLPQHDRGFLDLLARPELVEPCEAILGSDCTVFTMTTSCLPPGSSGLAMHRDMRVHAPGFIVGVGVLLLLDDVDDLSGTTRFYPRRVPEQPSPEDFASSAVHLSGPAGSVCWFDGSVWHDVPPNRSDRPRRVAILAFIRPWMRPRFDIPRMLAHLEPTSFPAAVAAKLGFGHLLPGSTEEYYLPADERRARLLERALEP